LDQKLSYCEKKVQSYGGTIPGWFDAYNPTYNWGFTKRLKSGLKKKGSLT